MGASSRSITMRLNMDEERDEAVLLVVNETIHRQVRGCARVLSPKLVVRATRRGRFSVRNRHNDVVLTIGQPNYSERAKLKTHGDCPFTIMKFFPAKKVVKKKKLTAKQLAARVLRANQKGR